MELREETINFAVATRVVDNLEALNFAVDMLDEFDPRLVDYRADALVSIHANSCIDFGELVTGFIVSKSDARPETGNDVFLRECIALNYEANLPLPRSYNETEDMLNNHAWRKIHPLTPGVILEMGFMLADKEILTTQHDLLAHAITMGILCYIENAASYAGLARSGRQSADYLVPLLATPTPIFGR